MGMITTVRAGISTVTETRPDGRLIVASERNGRATTSRERRAGRVTRFAAHASSPTTSTTNASTVTSPATTTNRGVGVEYPSTTSKGPIDTSFDTGALTGRSRPGCEDDRPSVNPGGVETRGRR
jgi:hypothetical protein